MLAEKTVTGTVGGQNDENVRVEETFLATKGGGAYYFFMVIYSSA
jgi:hypothetical protein